MALSATVATPAFAESTSAGSHESHPPSDDPVVASPAGKADGVEKAEGVEEESDRPSPAEHDTSGSRQATTHGAFLPFTIGASTAATYGRIASGYDGARKEFVYQAIAEAQVVGGLAIRAGYLSSDLSGHASAVLGGRFQFLSQMQHGLDMAAGLFYLPQDLDGEGLVKASVLVSRSFGDVRLFGNLGYGQDPEGDDGQAELAVGFLVPAAKSLALGLDARARARVFSTDEKHAGNFEPIFDVVAGPVAHYVLGPVVLTGHAGWSSVVVQGPQGSPQSTSDLRNGLSGLLSAGFAL
jgi:hypothetical protein